MASIKDMGFQEAINELNKLYEDAYSDYYSIKRSQWQRQREERYAAKIFWDYAKENILAVNSFHKAYGNDLRYSLGLEDIFDDNGLYKSKGVYGQLKNAVIDAPNEATKQSLEWALNAAKKFWALQFQTNAELASVVEKRKADEKAEQERIAKEKEEQERIYRERLLFKWAPSILEMTKQICMNNEVPLRELIEKIVYNFELKKKVYKLNPLMGEFDRYNVKHDINKYIAGIEVISKEFKNDNTSDDQLSGLSISVIINTQPHTFKLDLIDWFGFTTWYTIQARTNLHELESGEQAIRQLLLDELNSSINKINKKLDTEITDYKDRLAYESAKQAEEKAINARIAKINQNIKDAVNRGVQPDRLYTDEIIYASQAAYNKADAEYRSWSGSSDGSDGAAWDTEIRRGVNILKKYLNGLHWESPSSKFLGGTDEEFIRAVRSFIANNDQTIRFVK